MAITTITTKGQIVIPSRIRKQRGLKKGTKMILEERGEELVLKPLNSNYLERASQILKTNGQLSEKLLAEREVDKEKEGEE